MPALLEIITCHKSFKFYLFLSFRDVNYFGIQLQESTKAQIISEDNVKTWLIFNFRCFAPVPGILLFNYLLYVCIYSLICIPPFFIFRTFSGLSYIFFFFPNICGKQGIHSWPAASRTAWSQPQHQHKRNHIVLSCFQFLQLLCSQVMTLASPLICHPLFIRGYLSVGFFPFYCWPVFTSSLTLLTLAST